MKTLLTAALLTLTAAVAAAQPAARPADDFKKLTRAQFDALLKEPGKVLVLDVRRPDELIRYGSFPVFLNVQNRDLEKQIAWLPKDRAILTVSNHAQRAGAAGDLLRAKGFLVAGATGSEDYELAGGKAVQHIQPRPAASAPAP